MEPVYLDHHATTPCDPRVVEAMLPYFGEIFGNPAAIMSPHGRAAARAVDDARHRVASLLGVSHADVIFTSGATESNHLAFQLLRASPGAHVVTTAMEHSSVLEPLRSMESIELTIVEPDSEGIVQPDSIASAIRPDTKLVTVAAANGETGTVQPVEEIARRCSELGVPLHTDATQAIGKVAPAEPLWGAALLSLSAHKFYGPKGIGALIARPGVRVLPWTRGGGQERGIRSGTVNVPGVIGLVRALEIRAEEQSAEAVRLSSLRETVFADLQRRIPNVRIHGSRLHRLPGNLSVGIPGIDADAVILALRNFSISAGSACSTRERSPSAALRSLGLDERQCMEVFRIGMGRSTTKMEMERFGADLQQVAETLRRQSA